MFYYFFKDKQVVPLNFQIHSADKRYKQLTEDQKLFYIDHPNASVIEIKQCKVHEPKVVIEQSIDIIRKEAISYISKYSLETVNKFCTPYQFANAIASINTTNEPDRIYDLKKANEYIAKYITYGKICRDLYYKAKQDIDLCNNQLELNNIIDEYVIQYDNLEDNE